MKVLITGGAGFIGSHLSERLLAQGHKVTVIDDLSTGRIANIEHLQSNKNFSFVCDSVRNREVMHVLVDKCDCVYHLAAAVGVQLIVDEPVHTIETNIHGSEVVLEVANKFRKKVLLASSSEVYGKSDAVPFREDDDCVLGSTRFSRWSYGCSKAIEEFLGLAYHQRFGLDVVITRFFNTVGPRQTGQYGMVIPRFVESAIKEQPLTIFGTGQQTRCFAYVGDVVDGTIALMGCPEAAGRVFNIGSDHEISIEALADKIIEMTGSSSKKRFIDYEQAYGRSFDDMMRRIPCLDRIRETIGYAPKTSLAQALSIIIEHMRTK